MASTGTLLTANAHALTLALVRITRFSSTMTAVAFANIPHQKKLHSTQMNGGQLTRAIGFQQHNVWTNGQQNTGMDLLAQNQHASGSSNHAHYHTTGTP